MTHRVEDELRDLFAAIDDQIGPLAGPRPVDLRRRRRPVVLAVAAVLVVLLGVGALVLDRSRDAALDVDTAGGPLLVEGESFDRLAGSICERLGSARAGVAPRFATAEAYLLSAHGQRAAIERAIGELDSISSAAMERGLVEVTVAGLQDSLALLDRIVAAARAGNLDRAAVLWSSIDDRVARAFEVLVDRGVERCRSA